jgi:hypothetical protein
MAQQSLWVLSLRHVSVATDHILGKLLNIPINLYMFLHIYYV